MAKFKKGQSGNPNGRPRGSRNKSSLIKAQLTLDDAADTAAKILVAMLSGNEAELSKYGLKPGDITGKLKLEAVKLMLNQVSGEMKALAAEKKTEEKSTASEASKPHFTKVASISKKTG